MICNHGKQVKPLVDSHDELISVGSSSVRQCTVWWEHRIVGSQMRGQFWTLVDCHSFFDLALIHVHTFKFRCI